MSKLIQLAEGCCNGAGNLQGIINGLATATSELTHEERFDLKDNAAFKCIIGQLSFLCGEAAGPSTEAWSAFHNQKH